MAPHAPREYGPTSGSPPRRSRGGRRPSQGSSPAASSKSPQRVGRVTAIEQLPDGQDNKLPANDKTSLLERIKEQQLKQEQATFEQAQFQDKYFFGLRVAMVVVAICAIPVAITVCSLIIFDPHQDVVVKRVAESALFFSLIGLMGYVWRVFFNSASVSRLRPVTTAEEASQAPADQKPANMAMSHNSRPFRRSNGVDS